MRSTRTATIVKKSSISLWRIDHLARRKRMMKLMKWPTTMTMIAMDSNMA